MPCTKTAGGLSLRRKDGRGGPSPESVRQTSLRGQARRLDVLAACVLASARRGLATTTRILSHQIQGLAPEGLWWRTLPGRPEAWWTLLLATGSLGRRPEQFSSSHMPGYEDRYVKNDRLRVMFGFTVHPLTTAGSCGEWRRRQNTPPATTTHLASHPNVVGCRSSKVLPSECWARFIERPFLVF